MPRGIFWSGVLSSALFAIVALVWGLTVAAQRELPLPGSHSWIDSSGSQFAIGALLLTLPLAALLLRMAARLATRRIFDAIVTVFAVTGASVLTLASALLVSPLFDESIFGIASGGLSLASLFAALGVLSLKSYFEVQSSRTLSFLATLPLPLALGFTLSMSMGTAGAESTLSRSLFSALALTTSAAFAAIAIHALRHRQMFLERSGLSRLTGRVEPAAEGSSDSLGFQAPLAE